MLLFTTTVRRNAEENNVHRISQGISLMNAFRLIDRDRKELVAACAIQNFITDMRKIYLVRGAQSPPATGKIDNLHARDT